MFVGIIKDMDVGKYSRLISVVNVRNFRLGTVENVMKNNSRIFSRILIKRY